MYVVDGSGPTSRADTRYRVLRIETKCWTMYYNSGTTVWTGGEGWTPRLDQGDLVLSVEQTEDLRRSR